MKELCLTAKKRKSSLLLILAYVNHLKHWSNFWCYLADSFQFLSHLHSTCVYSGPNLHILGRSGREESMKITEQWKWGKKTAGNQLIQVKSTNQGNNYDKTKAFYSSQKAEFLIFSQYSFHLCIPHCLEETRARQKDHDVHYILCCRNFSVSEELEKPKIEQMKVLCSNTV